MGIDRLTDAPSKDHILHLSLRLLHPAQDHFWGALVPRVGGHWLAVHGSIVMGVFVGHRGDFDLAGFEGRRNSGKDLGRVHVLTDGPWWM